MRKRITSATVVALLLGLLVTALPGTALQINDGSDQPLASQSQGQSMEEDSTLAGAFLQALADKLGISVEELEQAIQAAKDELIEKWVERRAGELKQRLSQAEPRELLKFLLERHKAQRERLGQRMAPFGEELKQKRLIGPRWPQPQPSYMPPYYWPYNCVCYCSFPGWYPMPTPWQPQPLMPQKPQQPQPQWPQPKPQTPQGP